MHWNGEKWEVVPVPRARTGQDFLTAVTAVSTGDVWAVGYGCDWDWCHTKYGSDPRPIIEHWDGREWRAVPAPMPPWWTRDVWLFGVAAAAANDVWAVGAHGNPSNGAYLTLVEHWDGQQWSIVSSPNEHRAEWA
jgi:hypothetical protein